MAEELWNKQPANLDSDTVLPDEEADMPRSPNGRAEPDPFSDSGDPEGVERASDRRGESGGGSSETGGEGGGGGQSQGASPVSEEYLSPVSEEYQKSVQLNGSVVHFTQNGAHREVALDHYLLHEVSGSVILEAPSSHTHRSMDFLYAFPLDEPIEIRRPDGDTTQLSPNPEQMEMAVLNRSAGTVETMSLEAFRDLKEYASGVRPVEEGQSGTRQIGSMARRENQFSIGTPSDNRNGALAILDNKGQVASQLAQDLNLSRGEHEGGAAVQSYSVIKMDHPVLQEAIKEGAEIAYRDKSDKEVHFRPETGKEYLVRNNETGVVENMSHDEIQERIQQADKIIEEKGRQAVRLNGFAALLSLMSSSASSSSVDVDHRLRTQAIERANALKARPNHDLLMRGAQTDLNNADSWERRFDRIYDDLMSKPEVQKAADHLDEVKKRVGNSQATDQKLDGLDKEHIQATKDFSSALEQAGAFEKGGALDQMRQTMDLFGDDMNSAMQTIKQYELDPQDLGGNTQNAERFDQMNRRLNDICSVEPNRQPEDAEADAERQKRMQEMAEQIREFVKQIAQALSFSRNSEMKA